MQKAFPGGVVLTPDHMPHHHTLGTFNISIEGVDGADTGTSGYIFLQSHFHKSPQKPKVADLLARDGKINKKPNVSTGDVSMCVKEPLTRARKLHRRVLGQKRSEIIKV